MDWTRIEAAFIGAGIPDTHGLFLTTNPEENCGHEFWLELKVASTKTTIPLSLWRPMQIGWQTKRARLGGRVWNLVRRPSSSILHLIHGNRLAPVHDSLIIPDLTVPDGDFISILEFIRNHPMNHERGTMKDDSGSI